MRVRDVFAGGLILLVASCSDGGTPATAPSVVETTAPTTSQAQTTTSSPPTQTTTTVDRLAEIEAIFRDLELRRLDALYRQDEEAYRALFANEGLLEASLEGVFGTFVPNQPPDEDNLRFELIDVVIDRADCLIADIAYDAAAFFEGTENRAIRRVLERRPSGEFGYSYIGEDYLCDGPHPLD